MRWGYGKRVPPGPPRLVAFLMGACVENRCICVAFTLWSRRGLCETRASRRAGDSTARQQFICKGAAIVCRPLSSAQRSALCCCRFYDREIRARGSTRRLPAGLFLSEKFSEQDLFLRMRCFTCRLSDACPVDLSWHSALLERKETDSEMECESRTADLAQWQSAVCHSPTLYLNPGGFRLSVQHSPLSFNGFAKSTCFCILVGKEERVKFNFKLCWAENSPERKLNLEAFSDWTNRQ